jgi:hypothetical protein
VSQAAKIGSGYGLEEDLRVCPFTCLLDPQWAGPKERQRWSQTDLDSGASE